MGGVKKEPEKSVEQIKLDSHLLKSFLHLETGTVDCVYVTQVVGHGDETEACDVSVIPRLVELFLGCVVTGETLCRF